MLSWTTKPHLGTSGLQVVFLYIFELRTGTHVHLRTVTSRIESRSDPPLGYPMGLRVQLTKLSTLSTFLPSGSVLSRPWLQTPRSKRFLSHGEISVPVLEKEMLFRVCLSTEGNDSGFGSGGPFCRSVSAPEGMDPPLLGKVMEEDGHSVPSSAPLLPMTSQSLQKWAEAQTEKNNYCAQPCTPVGTKAKETKHTWNTSLGVVAACKVRVLAIEAFGLS